MSLTTRTLRLDPNAPDSAAIAEAAAILRAGGMVAFPTETVYGLGANAFDAEAVAGIFRAKGRPANDPIIVHLSDMTQLERVAAHTPPLAHTLAQVFWPGPLTLVLPRGARIPPNVSAGRDTVAVRMPAHPVAHALIAAAGVPVAAPSANTFSRPSATTAQHVFDDLHGRIALILDGGPAPLGVESTVLDLTGAQPVILRPGGISEEALRSFAPDVVRQTQLLAMDESAAAPGQLIRHYSPVTELRLYDGPGALAAMQAEARARIARGHRPGLLLMNGEQTVYAGLNVEIELLGDNAGEAAARLFAALRALDGRCDIILAHGLPREGLGAAVWDRLLRAAEGKVIDAP